MLENGSTRWSASQTLRISGVFPMSTSIGVEQSGKAGGDAFGTGVSGSAAIGGAGVGGSPMGGYGGGSGYAAAGAGGGCNATSVSVAAGALGGDVSDKVPKRKGNPEK